jgi:tetratricopeptide (TPR) repeat protein
MTTLVLWCALLAGQVEPPAASQPNVFDLPRIQAQYGALHVQSQALLSVEKYAEAERMCRAMIELVPFEPLAHYNLACTLARQKKHDESLAALEKAVSLGFNNVRHMEADDDLKSLHEREEFKQLLERAADAKPDPERGWKYAAEPTEIADRVALVSETNTAWNPQAGMFAVLFKFPPPNDDPAVKGFGEAGDLVRKWHAEGTAAGNHGDLYDNHDSDHSNMDYDAFPHLARIEFDEQVKRRQLHHGVQLSFLYNGPTIGNSSTAVVGGPFWRSQGRNALMQPRGPQLLYLHYANNQLYFYPEHRDHDAGRNGSGDGFGDVFPANTPYMLLSQGSSGSDRALMHAVALTLAALRPEVKAELAKSRTLMPAVQMIFRRGYKPVETQDDYLTHKAHPTVFDGEQLDLVRMVTLAHDLTLDSLPPIAQIAVVEEDQPRLGIDYFDVAEREKLFDTPAAVARVMKSSQLERRMVVSARESRDPQRGKITYHWVILRGDPERIAIKPVSDDRSVVEIRVKHHGRRPIAADSMLESNRVDLALIVENEAHYSAPAFISLNYLDNEKRMYDDSGRIQSIDYTDPETRGNYVDPLLDFIKDWRDEYHYNDAGELTGWTRIRGEERQQFTATGELVLEADDAGRPTKTTPVRYVAEQKPNEPARLRVRTGNDE